MPIEIRLHRLLVLRIVIGSCELVPVENFDDVGREGVLQQELLGGPLLDAGECRAEDHAHDPFRAGEDVLQREHASPRGAQEVDPLEP
jgi:hypothetical protein